MSSISISALSFSGTAYVSVSNNRAAPVATETDDQADEALAQDKPIEANDKATASPTRADGTPLAPEEIQLLEQLKQTDRDVRQHEMAHQIAGGAYTGGASYEYEIGPDGKRYAVAGEVPIDYGPIPGDPQATIEKMQTVIAAAMAPADPSPKDLQVAAQARQYLLEAKLEAAQQQSVMTQARGNEPLGADKSLVPEAETPLEQVA